MSSINKLENKVEVNETESRINLDDWKAGKKLLEDRSNSAKKNGDCGGWAQLAAEMSVLDPDKAGEVGVEIDVEMEKALKNDLERKRLNAEKNGNWYFYSVLAADIKKIDGQMEVSDDSINEAILKQLEELEKQAQATGKWFDYVGLLSKSLIINPDSTPQPSKETQEAIVADTKRANSAADLKYAARVRTIFPKMNAEDLGVDAGVLNEVNNNSDNFRGFYKNFDNLFELEANRRILTAGKVNVE